MVKIVVKKTNGKKKAGRGRNRAATRARATRVLAQGAGAITRQAFGARSARPGMSIRRCILQGLNARLPMHLGLPRPVGPYQVIRTTKLHTTSSPVVIFCPLMQMTSLPDNPLWYQACGIEATSVGPINDPGSTNMIDMPLSQIGSVAEMVPSAMTVQVMNKAPMQSASGLFTMARVNQQLALGGESRTWATFKDEFDSFFKPRLLTGGKLALRGVTCNAVPINMNEYSHFACTQIPIPGSFSWTPGVAPSALSPIVFTRDLPITSEPPQISFLVTIEWRVRFDPFHPAAASHTFHPSTSDTVWNGVIAAASAAGHGVTDIADEVADLGFDAAAVAGAGALLA